MGYLSLILMGAGALGWALTAGDKRPGAEPMATDFFPMMFGLGAMMGVAWAWLKWVSGSL